MHHGSIVKNDVVYNHMLRVPVRHRLNAYRTLCPEDTVEVRVGSFTLAGHSPVEFRGCEMYRFFGSDTTTSDKTTVAQWRDAGEPYLPLLTIEELGLQRIPDFHKDPDHARACADVVLHVHIEDVPVSGSSYSPDTS